MYELHGQTCPAAGSKTPHSRLRVLALSLSVALSAPLGLTCATGSLGATRGVPPFPEMPSVPVHPLANTWTVKNCDDSGTDSLRGIIASPMTQSGDKIDLSQLPTLCGMAHSTITLTNGEIAVAQDDLTLQGPTQGAVTISAANMSRVLHHTGAGTLSLSALTVSDGYFHTSIYAYGGCIESDNGNVFLDHVVVSGCVVASDIGYGNGGGISAERGNVSLIASQVSGNLAQGGFSGWGGGVYSKGGMLAFYSSISGNTAQDGPNKAGVGGGVATSGGATLFASSIEGNTGGRGGALAAFGPTTIRNSTISSNVASDKGGALFLSAPYLLTVSISNSTIAFNHSASANAGGIYFKGPASGVVTLQSSIVANNAAGAANTPADLYIVPGLGSLAGADNLVIAANVSDPVVITLTSDPKLGPLQFNGGRTRTHQLLPGSPALGQGNSNGLPPPWNTNDQRGLGYPRTSGPNASVDLGAVEFDSIFADGFDTFF
jgi:hypothetical protein